MVLTLTSTSGSERLGSRDLGLELNLFKRAFGTESAAGFGVWGVGFREYCLGFRVCCSGLMAL